MPKNLGHLFDMLEDSFHLLARSHVQVSTVYHPLICVCVHWKGESMTLCQKKELRLESVISCSWIL